MSKAVTQSNNSTHSSRLVSALNMAFEQTNTKIDKNTQFGFQAVLQTPYVILNNSDFDMEFEIPFDDDIIANEAEFVVYNLSQSTRNKFKQGNSIRLTAGYNGDTGVIFQGWISKVTTKTVGVDKVTTIYALDDVKYSADMSSEITYAEGTTASYILKDLLGRLGLTIAVFKTQRDHTYDSETKVDGSLAENIKEYSDVCGVSTYIYKQQVYCRPIYDGDNLRFTVNENTGMIDSPEAFEEENTSEEYIDTVKGYNVNMILQHRIATAGIVKLDSVDYSGEFRIASGKHSYDGLSATTEFKCISDIKTTIDTSKSESASSSSGGSVIDKAISWAVKIANDNSHKYSQATRWGPHYDCSSFAITAYQNAGVGVKSAGATYTGNMRNAFLSKGFKDVTSSCNLSTGAGMKKGDVLLNTVHHAALVQKDGGVTVEARSTSYGIVANVPYRNYPWNYVLRYKG